MQRAKPPNGAPIDPSQRGDASSAAGGAPAARTAQPDLPVRFGVLEGEAWIADDFDAPLPASLLDAFEGQ
jgi:hypothetical protein